MAQARNTVLPIPVENILALKLKYDIASILARSGTIQEALLQVLGKMGEKGGWDVGIAWLMDDTHLHYHGEWHKAGANVSRFLTQIQTASLGDDTGLPRAVIDAGDLVWINDISADPRFPKTDAAIAIGLRNAVAFPLYSDNHLYGVIALLRKSINVLDDDTQRVFTTLRNDIDQFLDARRLFVERMERFSLHDELTGLANRKLLIERGNQALLLAERNGDSVAILTVGLDIFKSLNSGYGQAVRNDLLILASERLSACVRVSDTVARFDGNEFVVLLPKVANADHSIIVAQKIISQMTQPFLVNGVRLNAKASVGISRYPHEGLDIPTLLRLSDEARRQVLQSNKSGYLLRSQFE